MLCIETYSSKMKPPYHHLHEGTCEVLRSVGAVVVAAGQVVVQFWPGAIGCAP